MRPLAYLAALLLAVLAIPDVRRFPRQVQDWLPPTADALAGYRSALLFDERALGFTPAPPAER